MSRTPWKAAVSLLANGELVEETVLDRPLIDLQRRTSSLKDDVENLAQKSGRLVFSGASLGTETLPGDFVYFDNVNKVFRPAVADTYQDPLKGGLVAGPRSRVCGMVLNKASPNEGDILLSGRLDLNGEGIDIDNLLDGYSSNWFSFGALYLSTRIPGRATPNRVFPSIQLGFFSPEESAILINHKDLFESHEHYRFDLLAKPSASQNYTQTGWTAFGASGPGVVKRVDYYNQGGSATPPPMIMCVRQIAGAAQIPDTAPFRIEFYNDGGLKISVLSGSITLNAPLGAADSTANIPVQVWPDYGAWVAVDGTNLEVSFVRKDGNYATTLAADANTYLTATTKRFKVFLPADLSGWTNCNTFDLSHSDGALYRYLLQNDVKLNGVFPPLPASSGLIELNGVTLQAGADFDVTHLGIFWRNGSFDVGDMAPWPADFSVVDPGSMVLDNAKTISISFIKSALGGLNSVVFSLKGVAPIKVSRCPDSEDAINGDLQVEIDLNLTTSTGTPGVSETSLSSVAGVDFKKSTMVSELIAGAGINLQNVTPSASIPGKNVGKVLISVRGLKFEGEMNSIALRNAKEILAPVGSYIDFIPTSAGNSGITASLKFPNEDFDPSLTKLYVLGQFRGDADVPGASSELFAMFKVVYHALRPGFTMSAMNDSNAIAVQYWRIPFAAGYSASAILPLEYPFLDGTPENFEINAATLVSNPSSLVALDGGFKTGDRIVVLIDRVTQDLSSNVANYTGRVGLSGLRWYLK
jgi:hypothetical protein